MPVNGDLAGHDLRAGQAQGPAAYRTGPCGGRRTVLGQSTVLPRRARRVVSFWPDGGIGRRSKDVALFRSRFTCPVKRAVSMGALLYDKKALWVLFLLDTTSRWRPMAPITFFPLQQGSLRLSKMLRLGDFFRAVGAMAFLLLWLKSFCRMGSLYSRVQTKLDS